MKTQLIKITSLMLLVVTFLACEDEQVKPNGDQDNAQTKEAVSMKTKVDEATFNVFNTKLRTSIGGRSSSGVHRYSGLFRSRSEAARVADDWSTCALITITENPKGTFTIILNFGEGCVDDGKFIKGIVAFSGSETDSTGMFRIAFDKFSERPVDQEEENDPATISGFYKGIWSLNFTDEFTYGEAFETALEVNHESGAKENLAAKGKLAGNENGFAVIKYDVAASNSNNDVFSSTVVHPLIFDFSCEETRIFTKGTEAWQVNGKGAVVDFGQGECDNILTIVQDGIIVIIDLDKINS